MGLITDDVSYGQAVLGIKGNYQLFIQKAALHPIPCTSRSAVGIVYLIIEDLLGKHSKVVV